MNSLFVSEGADASCCFGRHDTDVCMCTEQAFDFFLGDFAGAHYDAAAMGEFEKDGEKIHGGMIRRNSVSADRGRSACAIEKEVRGVLRFAQDDVVLLLLTGRIVADCCATRIDNYVTDAHGKARGKTARNSAATKTTADPSSHEAEARFGIKMILYLAAD